MSKPLVHTLQHQQIVRTPQKNLGRTQVPALKTCTKVHYRAIKGIMLPPGHSANDKFRNKRTK